MTFWPALLRVFLCLCLVLQGMQTAVAGASMGGEHAMHMAHALASHAAQPCHERDMSAHAGGKPAHAAVAAGHSKPDCCQHTLCNCACAHFAIAGVRLHTVTRLALAPQRVLLPLDDGLPEPVLPHLIRPPIG